MANHSATIKSVRKNAKRRLHNMSFRSRARTFVKKMKTFVEAKDTTAAQALFPVMQSELDKAAKRGLMHKNKVARLKSRLNARLKELVLAS